LIKLIKKKRPIDQLVSSDQITFALYLLNRVIIDLLRLDVNPDAIVRIIHKIYTRQAKKSAVHTE